ncbi:MAG: hypothetical protein LUI13_01535 [Lachnospiraceae bacterium]|nr:hypothetical protein [Lachnospiraceae bacterium]
MKASLWKLHHEKCFVTGWSVSCIGENQDCERSWQQESCPGRNVAGLDSLFVVTYYIGRA